MSVKVSADRTESIQRDVVFLVDSSDETQNYFKAMLSFIEEMVEKFSVAENKDRVSVVQYSTESSVQFFLNTHITQQNIADNVRTMRHKGGRFRNTGAALQYIKDTVFAATSGSRHHLGVPQILILLTGGRSSDDVREAAQNLKEMGVMVFVVGIKNADTLEIQTMSHEPSEAFYAAYPSDLSDIKQQILSSIKKDKAFESKPVLHGKAVIYLFCTQYAQHIVWFYSLSKLSLAFGNTLSSCKEVGHTGFLNDWRGGILITLI